MNKKKVIIFLVAVLVIVATVVLSLYFFKDKPEDLKQEDIVLSTAATEIVETGFCTGITQDAQPDTPVTLGGAGTICAYAKVDKLDRGTGVSVFITAPDGTAGNINTLAVNTNSYLFAYYSVTEPGEYIVTWTVMGKEPVESVFTVE